MRIKHHFVKASVRKVVSMPVSICSVWMSRLCMDVSKELNFMGIPCGNEFLMMAASS